MSFVFVIKKILATVITAIMLLLSATSLSAEPYEAKNPDELKLNFAVLSDTHIEGLDTEFTFIDTYKVFTKLLSSVKAAQGGNDAVVFLGDNTMNGQDIESMLFYGALRALKPADEILVAVGNHDLSNGEGDYNTFRERYIGYNNTFLGAELTTPYYYRVINGCYFIVLASEQTTVNTMYISDEQIIWLEETLSKADEENAPIFVMAHHPAYYLEGRAYYELTEILNDYDNLIYFCGHTHLEFTDESAYTYNGVDCINLPRSTEHKTEDYDTGIGAQVEVYEDEILVRIRDYYDGQWLEEHEYSYTID